MESESETGVRFGLDSCLALLVRRQPRLGVAGLLLGRRNYFGSVQIAIWVEVDATVRLVGNIHRMVNTADPSVMER
ncbi:hypothetical protein N7509_005941 [Penicillium cosmopolitanum]|uniref:Uncharacterized protein n=1 Tax=Penicillium cosmopolitanum TaxID=1131564 RepID=A0A9W9W3I1_9EURO|nr:uncharacterized protein N7509_005941 [Penicillium cosmopolitanum]KAJ5397828.1 hypothetical protein N7509_005941 [Penicillium cosmopolitanum]